MKHLLAPFAIAAVLLAGCSQAPEPQAIATTTAPAVTEAPKTEPAPEPTPTPQGIATTGSYESDVLALGIKPDNMDSYKAFMIKNACEDTGTALGISVRSIGRGTPENGSGPDILLLTATYYCPEQLPEIEKHLEYFDQ